jgi:Asp-tRNA(Asn)/Glu-tRNA(Gln) amidotransferase A subunit family amidase
MTDSNIPIGIELLAKPYYEANLSSITYSFEKASETRKRPQSTMSE